MKKSDKITFYISTGLLSLMMLGSAGMYFFKYDDVSAIFAGLGFPVYIIYPLAIAKILGLVAIWSNLSQVLKYLAYAGFFYNFLLAISAHTKINDGEFAGAVMALVLLGVSFFFERKITKAKAA